MVNRKDFKRAILYLLSHHQEDHLDRALCLNIFGKKLYICARCTGLTLGFISGILLQSFSIITQMDQNLSLLLAIGLALPAMVDWWTQSVFGRESKNYIRVSTGYALGFGITFLRFSNVTWTIVTIIIFFIFAAIGLYRRVIREYGLKSDKYVGKGKEEIE
ncbi:MAG: DUF2085 domain-containing protein [Candidatus Jordarchaeum sp.]|uniref:DUF2085 domain-containing protein n=1 Tax=Candidatus Jordarchaeum sp. TaxID=2823881 RepID=UPI00404B3082